MIGRLGNRWDQFFPSGIAYQLKRACLIRGNVSFAGLFALLLLTLSALTSKGVTRTKELIQGWKRSEILIMNTIRKSDLYVREYRPVDSSSRWSSVVIAANVVSEVVLVGVVDVRLKVGRVNKL